MEPSTRHGLMRIETTALHPYTKRTKRRSQAFATRQVHAHRTKESGDVRQTGSEALSALMKAPVSDRPIL